MSVPSRWFLSVATSESNRAIDLISLAMVSDDTEYYAVALDGWATARCSPWTKQNIVPYLPPRHDHAWRSRTTIVHNLIKLLAEGCDPPEVWSYGDPYGVAAFYQLFGSNVDTDGGFRCLDLKQEMYRLGIKREDLPASLLRPLEEHSALADAKWNRELHRYLSELET